MGIFYNGNEIKAIKYNGLTISKLMQNANQLWVPPVVENIVFKETFTRANGNIVVSAVPDIGTYRRAYGFQVNNQAAKPDINIQICENTTLVQGNLKISAKITRTSTTGQIGFIFNRTTSAGSSEHWFIYVHSNKVALHQTNGSELKNAAKTFTNGTTYLVEMTKIGKTLEVFVDGVKMFDFTDNQVERLDQREAGYYAYYCYGGHTLDDFTIYQL